MNIERDVTPVPVLHNYPSPPSPVAAFHDLLLRSDRTKLDRFQPCLSTRLQYSSNRTNAHAHLFVYNRHELERKKKNPSCVVKNKNPCGLSTVPPHTKKHLYLCSRKFSDGFPQPLLSAQRYLCCGCKALEALGQLHALCARHKTHNRQKTKSETKRSAERVLGV